MHFCFTKMVSILRSYIIQGNQKVRVYLHLEAVTDYISAFSAKFICNVFFSVWSYVTAICSREWGSAQFNQSTSVFFAPQKRQPILGCLRNVSFVSSTSYMYANIISRSHLAKLLYFLRNIILFLWHVFFSIYSLAYIGPKIRRLRGLHMSLRFNLLVNLV
jgi:hypothetical protein